MGKKSRGVARIDHVHDEYYSKFLNGNRPPSFRTNAADGQQGLIERVIARKMTELAMNRFQWEGLPDEIDPRFIEQQLFYRGLCVFYFDPAVDKYFALSGSPAGVIDYQQNATSFLVTGNQFITKTVSALRDTNAGRKAIPIWSNMTRMPDTDIVYLYAQRLATFDRTLEINAISARRTKVLVTSENQRLSAQNINDMLDRGEAVIPVNQSLGEMVQALDLGVEPKSLEELHIVRTREWNEAMTMLGIDNSNQDKKERLVSDEVDANNDQVSLNRGINLNERKRAAERINEYYGLNITVDYYSDADPAANGVLEMGTAANTPLGADYS